MTNALIHTVIGKFSLAFSPIANRWLDENLMPNGVVAFTDARDYTLKKFMFTLTDPSGLTDSHEDIDWYSVKHAIVDTIGSQVGDQGILTFNDRKGSLISEGPFIFDDDHFALFSPDFMSHTPEITYYESEGVTKLLIALSPGHGVAIRDLGKVDTNTYKHYVKMRFEGVHEFFHNDHRYVAELLCMASKGVRFESRVAKNWEDEVVKLFKTEFPEK